MEGTELDSDVAGWKLYHKLLYFLIRTVMWAYVNSSMHCNMHIFSLRCCVTRVCLRTQFSISFAGKVMFSLKDS